MALDGRTYYRLSFAPPVAIPLVVVAAAWALHAATRSTAPNPLSPGSRSSFRSRSGSEELPICCSSPAPWSDRGRSRPRRSAGFTFKAPLYFAVVFFLVWVPYVSSQASLTEALASGLFLSAYCVGLGYAYVALVHVVRYVIGSRTST